MAANPQEIDANRVLGVVAAVAREARPHVEAYVTLDSSLERELGLDSLARVELVLRLEREFAASLPEQALASSETPRDLLRFLLAAQGQAPQTRRPHRREPGAVRRRAQAGPSADADRGARVPRRTPAGSTARFFLYEDKNEVEITYRMLWEGALAYAARPGRRRPAARADGGDHAADVEGVPLLLLRHPDRGRHPGAALPAGAPLHHRGPPHAPRRHPQELRRRDDGDHPGGEADRLAAARAGRDAARGDDAGRFSGERERLRPGARRRQARPVSCSTPRAAPGNPKASC